MRACFVALLLFLAIPVLAAPQSELWPRFGGQGTNKSEIDHTEWDLFLQNTIDAGVDGINRLRYGSVSAEDRQRLARYLEKMQQVKITDFPRAEQRPYWINLYNAATVKVVLDHYPVDSITAIDISPGFFSNGPWGKKFLTVEGVPVSLDDIEHRILRPIWRDPRTHYSVNCASIGCPNLARRAYTRFKMDEMLDAAARAFINHERGVRVADGRLVLSSIYDWFADDFGEGDVAIIDHLRKYADEALRNRLGGLDEIDGYQYDWALNDYATKNRGKP